MRIRIARGSFTATRGGPREGRCFEVSSREVFISRLEADLEALRLERRIAEMRGGEERGESLSAGGETDVGVLRTKEKILRERLRRARDLPDDGWEREKKELLAAWEELTNMLTGHGA